MCKTNQSTHSTIWWLYGIISNEQCLFFVLTEYVKKFAALRAAFFDLRKFDFYHWFTKKFVIEKPAQRKIFGKTTFHLISLLTGARTPPFWSFWPGTRGGFLILQDILAKCFRLRRCFPLRNPRFCTSKPKNFAPAARFCT